ncbi:MAG: YceI family protein [Bacteroidetes bacterium]|nr:MAG: YceI family protein [Bacteroidota bacterium]
MKNLISLTILTLLLVSNMFAQVYITRNGTIRFFSETPLENIEATNRQVFSALNKQTGEFAFRVVMRSFSFEKALMQQHFNDNFVESDRYPNATFEGKVKDIEDMDFSETGDYKVVVEGELTIKDVTRTISEQGTLKVEGDRIIARSVFIIRPEDYNVSIPGRYARNIARDIEVTVELELQPR